MANFEPETTFGSNAHRSMQLHFQLHEAERDLNDVRGRSWRRQRVNNPAYKTYLDAKLACANDAIRHYEDTVCAESGGFSGYRSSIGSLARSITSSSQAKRDSSAQQSARGSPFTSSRSHESSHSSMSSIGTWTDDALQDMDALIRNAVIGASNAETSGTFTQHPWKADLLSGLSNIQRLHVDRLCYGYEDIQRDTMVNILYRTMVEGLPRSIDAAIYEFWGNAENSQVIRANVSEVVGEWNHSNAYLWTTARRQESTLGRTGAMFGGSTQEHGRGFTSPTEVSRLIDGPNDAMEIDWDDFAAALRGRQLVQNESGLFYPRCRSHLESPLRSPSGFQLPLDGSSGANLKRVEFAIGDRRPPREPIQCLVPVQPIQCRLLHISARNITMDTVFWAMTQHLDPEYVLRIAEFVVGLHCEGTSRDLNWEEDQECWERLNLVLEELNFDIVWTDVDGDTEMAAF